MRMNLSRTAVCTALIALTLTGTTLGASKPPKPPGPPFRLILQELVENSVEVKAAFKCNDGWGYDECLLETKDLKIEAYRRDGNRDEQYDDPAAPKRDSNGNGLITFRLRRALALGDHVSVTYNKVRMTDDRYVKPSDDEFAVSYSITDDRKQLSVIFPAAVEVEVRIKNPSGGLRDTVRRIEKPAADQKWVVNFPLKASSGDKLLVRAGTGVDLHEYPLITVSGDSEAPEPNTTTHKPAAVSRVAPPLTSGPCPAPYFAKDISETTVVQVILGCFPQDLKTDLQLFIDKEYQSDVQWTRVSIQPPTYQGKLSAKLKPKQVVEIRQNLQHDFDSPGKTVMAADTKPDAPSTVLQVREGATSVVGFGDGLEKVHIQVLDGKDVVDQQDATPDKETGKFTATFAQPLVAEQSLSLTGEAKGLTSDPRRMEVISSELDWGRVRAYFTAGMVLSSNSDGFKSTSAHPYVGLLVDKNWLRPRERGARFRFNTFFDARLTSIKTATAGGSGAPPTSAFSDSQAGSLQVGIYAPIIFSKWFYRNHPYSLYIAPMAKAGFYTVNDTGTSTPDPTKPNFYKFQAFGFRLGHYREFQDWIGRGNTHHSPQQLSYIDFTLGKWGNYEYQQQGKYSEPPAALSCDPVSASATANCFLRQREWRIGLEGILYIPGSPFIVGLSANVSAQRFHGFKASPGFNGLSYDRPPDDLRFLFGVRFDARKLLGALSSPKTSGN